MTWAENRLYLVTVVSALDGQRLELRAANEERDNRDRAARALLARGAWSEPTSLYDRAVAMQHAALVERELELQTVERLLAGARAGSGGVVVFEGPAGIGKSGLIAAVRAMATDMRVLSAHGGELERELPFGIVRQLLESVVVAADVDEREAMLVGAAALAGPVLFPTGPEAGAEPSFAALHGLYWLTINLADIQPLVLAVDDTHWADVDSLRWLIYLARRLEGVPLALVLTMRQAEAGPVQELLDELLLIPEVAVVQPGVLSERAIAMLAGQRLAAAPDPSFVTACRQATGGNPFLLVELFGELGRRGIAPSRDNAGRASQLSSQGVGRAVRARLRRLPPGCTALARAVAVLGDPAEPSPAGQLAGLDDNETSSASEVLADAAIFEPGRLAFVHPLVRSSVYSELSAQERAGYHERAARLLTIAGETPDRVAVHLMVTRPGSNAETVKTLRQAAEDASCRGAPAVAVTYLQRALAEPPSPDLEPALVHELGQDALSAGELDLAIEQLRRATRALADDQLRTTAANELGNALVLAHRPEEAMMELTAVIDELPESEREHGLRLQATRWIASRGSVEVWRRIQATGERFVVTSRTPRTTGERLQVAVAAYDAARTGTAAEAGELALRALADGQLLEEPGPESGAFWIAPFVLVNAHADDDAMRVSTEVIEWAKRHGSLPAFSMAAQLRAYVWLRRGSLAEAEADAVSALEHRGLPGIPPYGYAALVNVLLARGRLTEAEDIFARAPFEPGTSMPFISLRYPQTRARLRAASQRYDEAVEDLFACGRLEREWDIRTPMVTTWRADAAPLLAALGRHDEARALAWEELARCRAFGAPVPLGAALRTLGLVEPGDSGIAPLEQAVTVLASSSARLEHALALLELGAAFRRAGRRVDAREPLREALELARACGAGAVAARAHDELVTAGARPRRDPIESRSNLTASELRVARLAAEGTTNREIAQALFLTENTIETHLRSVFRKLDIHSRSQLARAL
jgi:DNA-binding CsgD family transcriptional regulator